MFSGVKEDTSGIRWVKQIRFSLDPLVFFFQRTTSFIYCDYNSNYEYLKVTSAKNR